MPAVHAALDQVAEGTVTAALADDGTKVALLRSGGVLYALADTCPHAGGPLSEGTLVEGGRALQCPWHKRSFDVRTGICVDHTTTKGAQCVPVVAR